MCGRDLVCSDHVHTGTFAVEFDQTVGEGEQGVVFTATDTDTRMHFGAALTHDDVAGDNNLSAVFFHAEALAA